ncbi:hypothetical protein V496_05969 [Pseudogymnoascus sp. VKM F-4515 (FW-2607)]|nr:hypothetical protein V496_05969 [Pseudogymnoascus sp. VKM F-4515 (FW-2607)]KFY90401.1 hypothetical protein V498_05995 [Pseudogymnoascus sp. VKM F-4517 (FW-2822)]
MSEFPVVDGVTVLMPPPPGVVPNFDHPRQNEWLAHYLVFGILGPLAFLALLQRFYTKLFLTKSWRLQLDDFFMFLGWSMSIVTQVILTVSIAEGGMCAHAWEMPLERFERYSVATYVAAPVYQLCNGFTKLSLLIVYMRLSPQKWFRIAGWFSIVVVVLYTAVISILMFFHCHPVRRAFDFKIQTGSCLDAGALYIATAISNIVTDIMLFLLPTPVILKLRMSTSQKVGILLVFGIASLTVATSIIRLVYLPRTLKSTDISWDAAEANVWTFVEGNLFVICGSIPTMRRFFTHMFPGLFGSLSAFVDPAKSPQRSNNTHSGSRRRNHLNERPPDSIDLQSFPVNGEQRNRATPQSTAVVTSSGDADNHSERAILQTRTYTVQSEQDSISSLDSEHRENGD